MKARTLPGLFTHLPAKLYPRLRRGSAVSKAGCCLSFILLVELCDRISCPVRSKIFHFYRLKRKGRLVRYFGGNLSSGRDWRCTLVAVHNENRAAPVMTHTHRGAVPAKLRDDTSVSPEAYLCLTCFYNDIIWPLNWLRIL